MGVAAFKTYSHATRVLFGIYGADYYNPSYRGKYDYDEIKNTAPPNKSRGLSTVCSDKKNASHLALASFPIYHTIKIGHCRKWMFSVMVLI